MADLKLDNEFGSALAGAGSRPAFSNLVKYRQREEVQQREFPTTLRLTNVRVQVGANSADVDAGFRARCNDSGVYCQFRIANEFFKTASFKPDGGAWAGRGDIQFMLASNCSLFVKVLIQSEPEATFGFARINLTGVGDGSFELTSEVKESEYVTPQDEVLGYITVGFTVIPNFALNVSKLENQYDTKNIPALINVISLDSKTLGHRMGTFQSALQILQNIVAEMQRQGAVGAVTSKQLSVILNQASSAQGVELFEDLLWDVASLSFANHIFEPSLAFFPSKPLAEALAESRAAVGDLFDQGSSNAAPWSFALLTEGQDPVVLAADSEADWLRWTAVLRTACDANAEVNAEKLKKLIIAEYCKDPVHPDHPTAGWLRRKKAQKKALTGDYVKRFFKLECDAENHYSLFYGHEPKDCESDKTRTRIMLKEGTRLVLPSMLPIPTPFALQPRQRHSRQWRQRRQLRRRQRWRRQRLSDRGQQPCRRLMAPGSRQAPSQPKAPWERQISARSLHRRRPAPIWRELQTEPHLLRLETGRRDGAWDSFSDGLLGDLFHWLSGLLNRC